ncbi:MAG: hypothetical protein ABIJ14_01710 [Nanoarchaeota archaeon]|nr:hypothetical protein [Nanoarchaeota archaeon]
MLKELSKYEFPLRKNVGLYTIISGLRHIILRNLANVSPTQKQKIESQLTIGNFMGYLSEAREGLEKRQQDKKLSVFSFDPQLIERLDHAEYLQKYLRGFSNSQIIHSTKRLENLTRSMQDGSATKDELIYFYHLMEGFEKVIPTENPEDFHTGHKL